MPAPLITRYQAFWSQFLDIQHVWRVEKVKILNNYLTKEGSQQEPARHSKQVPTQPHVHSHQSCHPTTLHITFVKHKLIAVYMNTGKWKSSLSFLVAWKWKPLDKRINNNRKCSVFFPKHKTSISYRLQDRILGRWNTCGTRAASLTAPEAQTAPFLK